MTAPARGPALPTLLLLLVVLVAGLLLGALWMAAGVPAAALGLAGAGLLAGGAGAVLLANRITAALRRLGREAEAIRRLDLAGPVAAPGGAAEVNMLGEAMGGMKSALRLFSVYVPRDLVRKLMAEGAEVKLGGERRRLTVMSSRKISLFG